MTTLDWVALAFVALNALTGLRRGLVGTVLALAGLVGGAIAGDRIAPHLLSKGSHSDYTPLVAFFGAIAGALIGRAIASLLASFARNGLRLIPPLHALDSIGGLLAGAAFGLTVVWVLGAVALEFPGETTLRADVQQSQILRRLNQIADPADLLHELGRFDELPTLVGPFAQLPPPPSPHLAVDAAVRAAEASVVRVTGDACGLGVEGSGWVARHHLVVTAAHVVRGATGILVNGAPARVFAFDPRNDVAVLDVPALSGRPLPYARPHRGAAVTILGYPLDGGLRAAAGRIGQTATVSVDGTLRLVTEFSGTVEPGNSGGPALSAAGVVEATVFARLVGADAGYGVPDPAVAAAVAHARAPVANGSC